MDEASLTDHQLIVLILYELRGMNQHFRVIAKQIACHNAAEMPDILRRIDLNTRKQVDE
jgi:hypothetical protein